MTQVCAFGASKPRTRLNSGPSCMTCFGQWDAHKGLGTEARKVLAQLGLSAFLLWCWQMNVPRVILLAG